MGSIVDGAPPPRSPRVVLAHDWLVGLRGGERVLDRLARMYGPATLLTLVANGRLLTPAIDACHVRTSLLQALPGAAGRLRRTLLPLMPLAVECMRVPPCDLLLSTSSAVIKSLRPPKGTPHLCYCHSPARYVWEQTSDYARGRGGVVRGAALRAIGVPFRAWDRWSASRVTRFLANSRHTAARIERAYGRDAFVVHPPVRTETFTPEPGACRREDVLLTVAALEPYKRTELVIQAANRSGRRLIVVGTGSQFETLRKMAGPTVSMPGRVDDAQLRDLYRKAQALIFPQTEDFGIVAAEALACGCPVIAYHAGGALDIIEEGVNGCFFRTPDVSALIDAVRELERRPPSSDACRRSAEQFSEARFDAVIDAHVRELLGLA